MSEFQDVATARTGALQHEVRGARREHSSDEDETRDRGGKANCTHHLSQHLEKHTGVEVKYQT